MRGHGSTVFLIIFTVVVSVMTVTATLRTARQSTPPDQNASPNQQQNGEREKGRLELERRFPVAEFGSLESIDTEEGAKRKSKNSRYDKHGFAIKDPSPRIAEQAVVTDWALHVAPLPAAESDAIVIGEVLDVRAHISNDRSAVYSEFTVRVGDVL